ncbi:hypothetical protein BKA83DRAFT_4058099, partial [Pisolithus microcarpus]
LPNGQIAQSLWQERLKPVTQVCISRNVKVDIRSLVLQDANDHLVYLWCTGMIWRNIALIHLHCPPDRLLLKKSSHTLVSSKLVDEFAVMHVKLIKSVVGMILHHLQLPSSITEDHFFLLEKLGLDISQLGIPYSVYQEDDDQDAGIK